jgi:hypothetical protein
MNGHDSTAEDKLLERILSDIIYIYIYSLVYESEDVEMKFHKEGILMIYQSH